MKKSALYFLTVIFLSCIAHSQQVKEGQRTCRVLFLERPSDAPKTLHLFDGTASREVDLPSHNLSKVYELPSGPLRISLLSAPLDDPEKLPSGAPTAMVPESAKDIYLLVMNDPSNKVNPVCMQVIDVNAAKLQRGQILWYNLTELTIGGKLGTETIIVKPLSRAVMNAPRSDAGDYPVKLAYHTEDEKQLYPICETIWRHDPRNRNLGFMITRPNSRTPRILVFPDFRHVE